MPPGCPERYGRGAEPGFARRGAQSRSARSYEEEGGHVGGNIVSPPPYAPWHFLNFLPGPAPAGIVAADVLVLVHDLLLRR